jgi:cytochrome c oxidase assembly protein subunit 11
VSPTPPIEPSAGPRRRRRLTRNALVALICGVTFAGMVGAAYAAIPLYKAFCQLTGYNGTVRRAKTPPKDVLARTVQVRFDTNVRDLPWTFSAEQTSQRIHIGDQGLAFFKVTNNSDKPVTARAVYNVTPEQAAPYFQKLECFCFTNQTLKPGETANFPVVYFVDPQYAKDADTTGQDQITLSYTFYRATDVKPVAQSGAGNTPQPLGGTPRAGL